MNQREPKLNQVKMSSSCPCFMTVKKEENSFSVTFIEEHSHEDTHFLKLNREVSDSIFIKLSVGLSPSECLKQARTEFPSFFIELKDILNIKSKHFTESLDKNDRISCRTYNHIIS